MSNTTPEQLKRWPFVESPRAFSERLTAALQEFGAMLPAVRHVLIENPPTLAEFRQAGTRWYWRNSDESQYWRYGAPPIAHPGDVVVEQLYVGPALVALAEPPKPVAPEGEALTDTFVQKVPDKCDRIVWRNAYYSLPITPPSPQAAEPVATAEERLTAALRQARFCITQLLPDDEDAQLTVRIIDAALRGESYSLKP